MKIELIGINKSFGNVHANININLSLEPGRIHGILGENGAGKSTLMKIISGYQKADSGVIYLDSIEYKINTPFEALKSGIGMLHQDPMDFPPMNVIDNFIAGSHSKEMVMGLFPNRGKIRKEFISLSEKFGFKINPESHIDTLTVGERQQVEILRLLWLGVNILILDEPTTGISSPQKKLLFETLKKLASEGKIILFVSHKLEDVEEICEELTVLRQGAVVGSCIAPFRTDDIIGMMFGKQIERFSHPDHSFGDNLLVLTGVGVDDPRQGLENTSLAVRSGEIIGLAGMEGSGQTEFLRVCAGITRPTSGKIEINSINMTGKNYHDFVSKGVNYIPAARLEEGLIPGMSISEHFSLLNKRSKFFLDQKEANQLAQEKITEYNIKGGAETHVESLSGGNQQRTQLALINPESTIILMEHPTRGLDVESSIYIWQKLKERCVNGSSIIFITSDLEEIIEYSDRIIVFFSGKISNPIFSHDTNTEEIGSLIGGKGWQS